MQLKARSILMVLYRLRSGIGLIVWYADGVPRASQRGTANRS